MSTATELICLIREDANVGPRKFWRVAAVKGIIPQQLVPDLVDDFQLCEKSMTADVESISFVMLGPGQASWNCTAL